jgi:GntR family transcriptional repressor for pyruvate dehydrogenase complex
MLWSFVAVAESIKTIRLADTIASHIKTMILEGVLRPGEKLNSERELADKMGVSRPSLRDALAQLETAGLLVTTKSGTTVARFLSPLSDPLGELFGNNPRVVSDYFEYRRLVESHASRLAAQRATREDREAISTCLQRMKAAHTSDDRSEEADADVSLHVLIYEAAHNVVFLHIMRVLSDMLRKGIIYDREQLYRRPGVRDALLAQHLRIGEAVLAAAPEEADKAASEHLRYTFETVEDIRRDEIRQAESLRRIDRKDLLAD